VEEGIMAAAVESLSFAMGESCDPRGAVVQQDSTEEGSDSSTIAVTPSVEGLISAQEAVRQAQLPTTGVQDSLRLYRSAAETYQKFLGRQHRAREAKCWIAMADMLVQLEESTHSGSLDDPLSTDNHEQALVCYRRAENCLKGHLALDQQQQQQSTKAEKPSTFSTFSSSGFPTMGGSTTTTISFSSENSSCDEEEPAATSVVTDDNDEAHDNIDILIVEALHKRARAHGDENSIDCHKEVVRFLLDVRKMRTAPSGGGGGTSYQHHQYSLLLQQSLGTLARLYQQYPHRAELAVLENALQAVRSDGGTALSGDLLVSLGLLYVQECDLDAALRALDEAVDVLSPHDRTKALQALEAVGRRFEAEDAHDQAMVCYEKVLLQRSQLYGSSNLLVAQSLINVARVMESQGNLEGSLDLYRAAQSIYTSKLSSADVNVEDEDVKSLMELFPTALEQGRFKEAVAYLSKVIEVAERLEEQDKKESSEGRSSSSSAALEIDKTYVFYNLGKAYVGLSDYVSATVCLLEAAKYDGQISEEVVFALLQQVEFLQREAASQRQTSSHAISSSSDESGLGTGSSSSYGTAITSSDEADSPVEADITLPLALRRNREDLTPITSELSYVSNGDESGDEGTAYYDSESPSANDPMFRSDISSSLFESDLVSNSDALLASDALHSPKRDRLPTDVQPCESELEGAQIDIPDVDDSVQLLKHDEDAPSLPSLRGTADTESRTFSGFRLRLGSPRVRVEPKHAAECAAPSSQRSSLAKTLTGKFRRQRRSCSGFHSDLAHDPLENSLTPPSEGERTPLSSSIPSEEDYHSTLEGPVQYVTVRSKSFDSCISQITLRFDDPNRAKDTSHEWWWSVTAEGIARWFPTSYVSKAVEAAEGFLSAQSIHSKVRSTPFEYVSDEEDSMEEKESSGGEVVDHPSYVGVTGADSKTLLSGVEGRARAKLAEARREAAMVKSPRSDGAVSVYSGHPKRSSPHLEKEIVRFSDLLESQRAKLGKSHPDVATSLFTLAVLYSRNGASAPAIEHAAEALGIQKNVSKLDDVSRSLHFLADVYLHQRQYSTALSFYTEALRIEQAHYGELSDEAAMALNCIGTVHSLQNEFLNAMQSHQEALRILYLVHDEDIKHPLITETLIAIGSVYYRERNSFSKTQGITEEQYTTFVETGMLETIGRAHEDRGSYKLAISFFEEKLQLMEHQGAIQNDQELEDVATTLNSLGMLSSRAGFYVEAIDYYEKALRIQLKAGCDKVQIATARVLTGAVHFQLGDWQKALKLHQEALTVLRKELGPEHQTFAATLYQLGVVQAALCEYDAAMSLLKQALGIQTRILGDDQPATLRTRREIANLYALYPSSCGLALEQLDDVLACQRLIHGDRHPNVAETLHSIGRAYSRAGDISSALQILEECYYMRTEFLGWDHPQQASTLHEICQLHLKRGRIKKALHIIDVVLGILRESLSDDHIDVALALSTKASCLLEHGSIEAAKITIKEALTIAEATVGPKHPAVADVCVQMASVQMRQCQFEDARKVLLRSIDIYKGSDVSEEYPGMLDALEKLDRVERDEMLCV
jgi:tetratricopeptide (TPR) repeat protein